MADNVVFLYSIAIIQTSKEGSALCGQRDSRQMDKNKENGDRNASDCQTACQTWRRRSSPCLPPDLPSPPHPSVITQSVHHPLLSGTIAAARLILQYQSYVQETSAAALSSYLLHRLVQKIFFKNANLPVFWKKYIYVNLLCLFGMNKAKGTSKKKKKKITIRHKRTKKRHRRLDHLESHRDVCCLLPGAWLLCLREADVIRPPYLSLQTHSCSQMAICWRERWETDKLL